MDLLLRWLPVVILVIQGLMAWGLWSLKQQFVSRRECDVRLVGVNARVGQTEVKVANLGESVHTMPPRSELQELSNKIGSLNEKLGYIDGRLSGINRAVDLLNQHHLRVNG
jgi:hypothetical protein